MTEDLPNEVIQLRAFKTQHSFETAICDGGRRMSRLPEIYISYPPVASCRGSEGMARTQEDFQL